MYCKYFSFAQCKFSAYLFDEWDFHSSSLKIDCGKYLISVTAPLGNKQQIFLNTHHISMLDSREIFCSQAIPTAGDSSNQTIESVGDSNSSNSYDMDRRNIDFASRNIDASYASDNSMHDGKRTTPITYYIDVI